MPRIYRVIGTDIHGQPVETTQPTAKSARRAVRDANASSAKRGQPQDWQAEYADFEWKSLAAEIE